MQLVEEPFINLGQFCTALLSIFFFLNFLVFVPLISIIENTLFYLSSDYYLFT
jgi:hypothetical protein